MTHVVYPRGSQKSVFESLLTDCSGMTIETVTLWRPTGAKELALVREARLT